MNRAFKFCPLCRYYLRKKRVDGHKRLVCQKCGWIYYGNPLPVAVCVVKHREDKMLIARRNLKPGINKWALPGGFVESGESPETACLRELEEETGLKGKIKGLIGVYIQKSRYYGSLLVIGYEVSVSKYNLSLNSELRDARFFSRKDLPVIPFSSHRRIIEVVYEKLWQT
ncbi:MAG: NUDIX hydrolase [Candidatus Omnitrophica bacterium]|nr:NUDIX hydrolase [Candidatus Omnitrophota bacterium]